MRRKAAIAVALVGLVLAAAIGAAGSPAANERATVTNLTIWVGWSARELNEFKKVVAEYDAKKADVSVKVVGSINDDKITAALRSGNVPDVVSSFTSQNVGVYCPSGGWIDLDPYLKRDKINTSIFPATTRYYTQYGGTRCALPLLADAYGFYYNKQLFRKAGLTRSSEGSSSRPSRGRGSSSSTSRSASPRSWSHCGTCPSRRTSTPTRASTSRVRWPSREGSSRSSTGSCGPRSRAGGPVRCWASSRSPPCCWSPSC